MGTTEVGYDECAESEMSQDPIDASDPDYGALQPGTWLCAKTSSDRFSALEVLAIDPLDTFALTIAYTKRGTWTDESSAAG